MCNIKRVKKIIGWVGPAPPRAWTEPGSNQRPFEWTLVIQAGYFNRMWLPTTPSVLFGVCDRHMYHYIPTLSCSQSISILLLFLLFIVFFSMRRNLVTSVMKMLFSISCSNRSHSLSEVSLFTGKSLNRQMHASLCRTKFFWRGERKSVVVSSSRWTHYSFLTVSNNAIRTWSSLGTRQWPPPRTTLSMGLHQKETKWVRRS